MRDHVVISFDEKRKLDKNMAMSSYKNIAEKIENYEKLITKFENKMREQYDHVKNAEQQIDDFVKRVVAVAEEKKEK